MVVGRVTTAQNKPRPPQGDKNARQVKRSLARWIRLQAPHESVQSIDRNTE